MSLTYVSTVVRHGRGLTEDRTPTTPLSAFVATPTCAVVTWDGAARVIDVSRMLVREARVALDQPIAAFLAERLTSTALVNRYTTTTAVPRLDRLSRRVETRVRAENAHGVQGLAVAYSSHLAPTTRNDPRLKDRLRDFVLSHPTRDLQHCLVAVNGYFHRTQMIGREVFALNGHTNALKAGRADIALIDTIALGGHTTVPITVDMVSGGDLRNGAYIQLPSTIATANTTALVVIDGVLLTEPGMAQVVGDHRIKVNTSTIDFVEWWRNNPNTVVADNPLDTADPYDDAEAGPVCMTDSEALDYFFAELYQQIERCRSPYTHALISIERCENRTTPTIDQRLDLFLNAMWDFEPRRTALGSPSTALLEFVCLPDPQEEPFDTDALEAFTEQLEDLIAEAQADLPDKEVGNVEMGFADTPVDPGVLTPIIPRDWATSEEFIRARLVSSHSFVVLIHTAHLRVKRYPWIGTLTPGQHECFSRDTPRGIGMYDHAFAIPYTIRSPQSHHHQLSVPKHRTARHVYKTGPTDANIPADAYDQHDGHHHLARMTMLELSTP